MSHRGRFAVIDGLAHLQGAFVCTWCGAGFPDRASLDIHWERDTRCRANRNVNNQTAEKYAFVEEEPKLKLLEPFGE